MRLTSLCAVTWENVPSDMCAQRRLRSACASAQSALSLRCPHEATLHPWLSKMCPEKILIKLSEWSDRSESSLCADVRSYVFRSYGSWHFNRATHTKKKKKKTRKKFKWEQHAQPCSLIKTILHSRFWVTKASFQLSVKTLLRLGGCTGWSGHFLFAYKFR